jgi:hypothetical protein
VNFLLSEKVNKKIELELPSYLDLFRLTSPAVRIMLSCPDCSFMVVMSRHSCLCCDFPAVSVAMIRLSCPGMGFFPVILSQLSCPFSSQHVLAVLFKEICPGCPVQTVLPRCPVPAALSMLTCSGHPVLSFLSWLSFPDRQRLLFFPGCPVLAVLSKLSSLPSCPCCHVQTILFNLTCPCSLSQIPCPGRPALAVLPGCPRLSLYGCPECKLIS